MKKVLVVLTVFASVLFVLSCGGDEEETVCASNEDCGEGYICEIEKEKCVPAGNPGETEEDANSGDQQGGNGQGGNGGTPGQSDPQGGTYVECTPGEQRECYEGPSGTAGVGLCKYGYKVCVEDGTDWSECREQVLPKAEICGDGIDQDCDGQDATPDNVEDIDGDGFTYCTGDCCETGWECPGKDPARISPISFEVPHNGVDDNCNGHIDEEITSACDSGINPDTTNPLDMAASMDLCPVEITTYGVVSAKLLLPDGTGSIEDIQKAQYGVLPVYGNNLHPRAGMTFLALSNGDLNGTSISNIFTAESQPPQDWFQANGGQTFPDAPGCQGFIQQSSPGEPPVNDPIMLELEIRAPNNAEAFSVDVYYISAEFPTYVCQYNDFFVMLLDSSFTTDKADLQNPFDKNIAMDTFGNPLGINLARSGLFSVCCPREAYPSCQGDDELKGTLWTVDACPAGLIGNMTSLQDAHGATGWLTVRGNIVPKEDFKLRLALWDTNDHQLDSMVLLDNFTWYESAGRPGIAPK